MARKWIKLWGEKLLSSTNFQRLRVSEKGTYMCLLLLARTDGEHQGKLVYPNGRPISTKDIAETVGSKRHETTQRHMDRMLEMGMLEVCGKFGDEPVYLIRKYAELQLCAPNGSQLGHKRGPTGTQTGNISTERPNEGKDLGTAVGTEEKRSRRDSKDKRGGPRWGNNTGVENLQEKWGCTFSVGYLKAVAREFGPLGLAEAIKVGLASTDAPPREPERYLWGIARKISAREDDGQAAEQGLAAAEAGG